MVFCTEFFWMGGGLESPCVGRVYGADGAVHHPQASACNTDTTPTQPHRISNTHRTKNNTTNVVIQQNSRKLLMMNILMSETCWAHKKWNKIVSDIKLVFYSSTSACMAYVVIRIVFSLLYSRNCLVFFQETELVSCTVRNESWI